MHVFFKKEGLKNSDLSIQSNKLDKGSQFNPKKV